jgi:hypothetical protein
VQEEVGRPGADLDPELSPDELDERLRRVSGVGVAEEDARPPAQPASA